MDQAQLARSERHCLFEKQEKESAHSSRINLQFNTIPHTFPRIIFNLATNESHEITTKKKRNRGKKTSCRSVPKIYRQREDPKEKSHVEN